MGKEINFREKWRTLTEVGTLLGVSARKMGLILKEFSLREEGGEPLEFAKENGYCHYINSDRGYGLIHNINI